MLYRIRAIVAGDRRGEPEPGLIASALDEFESIFSVHIHHLVVGSFEPHRVEYNPSSDMYAAFWALHRERDLSVLTAKWSRGGPPEGPIRNTRMPIEAIPDVILTFPGGSGTEDMRRKGIRWQAQRGLAHCTYSYVKTTGRWAWGEYDRNWKPISL